jgi:hypothetical protein
MAIWYIFPRFGILEQEKSGNPANNTNIISLENGPMCRILSKDVRHTFFQLFRTENVSSAKMALDSMMTGVARFF